MEVSEPNSKELILSYHISTSHNSILLLFNRNKQILYNMRFPDGY